MVNTVSRLEISVSALLGGAYALLAAVLGVYTSGWGFPAWWTKAFGGSHQSALAFLQLAHSVAFVAAALPVAAAICHWFRAKRYRVALVAAAIPTAAMLFFVLRGLGQLARAGIASSSWDVISPALDVIKISAVLLLLVFGISRLVPGNSSLT